MSVRFYAMAEKSDPTTAFIYDRNNNDVEIARCYVDDADFIVDALNEKHDRAQAQSKTCITCGDVLPTDRELDRCRACESGYYE